MRTLITARRYFVAWKTSHCFHTYGYPSPSIRHLSLSGAKEVNNRKYAWCSVVGLLYLGLRK